MSVGPGSALSEPQAGSLYIAGSAVVLGTARLGERSLLAPGAVIRSHGAGVEVGTGSAVLENSVVVGSAGSPTIIGRRSVFGHRCAVVGAVVGDLCEVGNASILMPGARVGDRVFLGEGTPRSGGDDTAERGRGRRQAGARRPVRLSRRP
jgi:carbonic anhydrase/acetyltransferase-like protein (isoleucine patch superfamily)